MLDATPALKRLTIDFGVVLLDVGAEPVDQLSGHRTLKGGLLGLRVTTAPPAEQAAAMLEALEALDEDPSTVGLFLRYFLAVSPRTARKVLSRVVRERAGKESVMQSMSDYLESLGYRRGERKGLKLGLARGLEKGRVQGRAQGRAQARAETLRQLVLQVLLTRFKKVSPAVEARLAAADIATLETWHQKALTARSLTAVFAAD